MGTLSGAARAIVSVRLDGSNATRDVELPVDVPAGQLSDAIAAALGWTTQPYALFSDPPGRRLAGDETLAEAGAWDGAWLTLRATSADANAGLSARATPTYVWRRIDDR
jgi:hypothetical protein